MSFSKEAKVIAKDHEIDIFRKPFDESKGFRQGGSTFQKQSGMPVRELLVEQVEHETDPKVLFHIAWQRVQATSRRFEYISSVPLRKSKESSGVPLSYGGDVVGLKFAHERQRPTW